MTDTLKLNDTPFIGLALDRIAEKFLNRNPSWRGVRLRVPCENWQDWYGVVRAWPGVTARELDDVGWVLRMPAGGKPVEFISDARLAPNEFTVKEMR